MFFLLNTNSLVLPHGNVWVQLTSSVLPGMLSLDLPLKPSVTSTASPWGNHCGVQAERKLQGSSASHPFCDFWLEDFHCFKK